MPDSKTNTPYPHKLSTIAIDIQREDRPDGSILLQSRVPLDPHPYRLTERLAHWAAVVPDRIFIGSRTEHGTWATLTYGETMSRVRSLSQALLDRESLRGKPVVILSENSIEHALMGLSALHAGIPYAPLAPAYSLRSTDFDKLKSIMQQLSPGMILVGEGQKYAHALDAVAGDVEVVSATSGTFVYTPFDELLETKPTSRVDEAFDAIRPDTLAKILFTSGSTGLPKGVMNTHENISTNWQQISQTFPFLQEEGLELVDWLPWNHTYGGNHNFGTALYNGGTFYIDSGNPTPQGIQATLDNLRERSPSVYFNVPRGFEELIPHFERDGQLREKFFSRLKMLFYAGATMPQHVWDKWEHLSVETTGRKILMATGLGCTETCPSALFVSEPGGFEGVAGVPVPGLELKLVVAGDKMEARYRGKNVFQAYWQQPDLTKLAFDEEGFYCSGDALRWIDEKEINRGLLFDGRITEDFKLSSGTWVRVGLLRSQLIAAGHGLIQDVVITGHDKEFVGAIVFAGLEYCRKIARSDNSSMEELIRNKEVRQLLVNLLNDIAVTSTGSATLIRRALLADFAPDSKLGELTDKGSINQRAVIQHHPETIVKLYAAKPGEEILEIDLPPRQPFQAKPATFGF